MAKCTELNCVNDRWARGLCSTHYARWLHSEEGERLKMKGYGERKKHPLYECWRHMNRMQFGNVCPEWADFWVFVDDVKEKPPKCFLKKKDSSKPLSKDNFEWVRKIILKEVGETQPEYVARYLRDSRSRNKDYWKNSELQKTFGITLDDYNVLLEKQNGGCWICGITKDQLLLASRRFHNLVVDHCHATGKIRGLLCSDCNRGIGLFKDNVVALQNAVNYLKDSRV